MAGTAPLIVIVEDDAATLKALGRALRAAGFETAGYASAEAFLASPPAHGAHCMVLDIQLGGMSGLELQRKLKASGSRVPVIVMTAFDDVHIREEATRIGCLGYLDKAADLDVLVNLIRSV
jgi:FixJ family two-component response regulator